MGRVVSGKPVVLEPLVELASAMGLGVARVIPRSIVHGWSRHGDEQCVRVLGKNVLQRLVGIAVVKVHIA